MQVIEVHFESYMWHLRVRKQIVKLLQYKKFNTGFVINECVLWKINICVCVNQFYYIYIS